MVRRGRPISPPTDRSDRPRPRSEPAPAAIASSSSLGTPSASPDAPVSGPVPRRTSRTALGPPQTPSAHTPPTSAAPHLPPSQPSPLPAPHAPWREESADGDGQIDPRAEKWSGRTSRRESSPRERGEKLRGGGILARAMGSDGSRRAGLSAGPVGWALTPAEAARTLHPWSVARRELALKSLLRYSITPTRHRQRSRGTQESS